MILEPLGTCGLSNLPATREREVFMIANQLKNLAKPSLRWEHVVFRGVARAGDVELGSHAREFGTASVYLSIGGRRGIPL